MLMREKLWFRIAVMSIGWLASKGRVKMNAVAANEDRRAAASGIIHFARFETMNEYEVVKRCFAHF
jgi:hypothetical protein